MPKRDILEKTETLQLSEIIFLPNETTCFLNKTSHTILYYVLSGSFMINGRPFKQHMRISLESNGELDIQNMEEGSFLEVCVPEKETVLQTIVEKHGLWVRAPRFL